MFIDIYILLWYSIYPSIFRLQPDVAVSFDDEGTTLSVWLVSRDDQLRLAWVGPAFSRPLSLSLLQIHKGAFALLSISDIITSTKMFSMILLTPCVVFPWCSHLASLSFLPILHPLWTAHMTSTNLHVLPPLLFLLLPAALHDT